MPANPRSFSSRTMAITPGAEATLIITSGSRNFINWNWPPSYTAAGKNVVDPSVGTTTKGDYWRTTIATENRVRTAQQITGITPRTDQVRDPGSYATTPNNVELAWHYYL